MIFGARTSLAIIALFAVVVSGCGQNSSMPAANMSTSSTSTSPASSCLDTNKQLRTPPHPTAPREKPVYESWIAQNAVPVRSELCDRDFSDLQPFGAIVGGKRIVGLGESSHGVGDYSSLKIRLIKYLHEDLGFDVIAFEFPMFQDYVVNQRIRSISAKEAMWHGSSGVWWSTQTLPLFEYIKEQATTRHPLILAGFDIQQYSDLKERANTFYSVIAPVDQAYASKVAAQDLSYMTFINSIPYPLTKKWHKELGEMLPGITDFYGDLGAWMGKHMKKLVAAAKNRELPGLMQQVAIGTPAYAKEYFILINGPSNAVRDAAMAADIKYLATKLYPDKKIILWSHNAHIAVGQMPWRNMGSVVKSDFGDAYYATGLFPYRGHGAYNNREVYKEKRPPARSIDAILYYTRWRWAFIDMSQQQRVAGNAWMWGPPLRYDDFGLYYALPPAIANQLFDGLMYVYWIHPPNYLLPKEPMESAIKVPIQ